MAVRVFIGLKIFVASLRRRVLRSGEECLRSSVQVFAVAYPKVGKGLRSDVGLYAAADQKGIPQKFYACYASAYSSTLLRTRSMDNGFFSFFKT